MSDLQSARACRNYAGIFPELASDLSRLEAAFLRHVVSDQLNQGRNRPLELRRVKVAAWPDFLADLENAADRKAGGLTNDMSGLKTRLLAIADEMDAHDVLEEDDAQIPQLRKVAGITTELATDSSEFPAWVNHFGRKNPNLLFRRQRLRLQEGLSVHPTLKKHRLEEVYLLDFIGRNIGAHGAMGEFATEAYAYRRSPWFWGVNTDLSKDLIDVISKAINQISPIGHQIAALLWDHHYAWHYASKSEAAAHAVVEAIMSVYDAIRFVPEDHITSSDQVPEIQGMKEAVARLQSAREALAEELAQLYPNQKLGGIVDNKVEGDMVGTIIFGIKGAGIKLVAPRSPWKKLKRMIAQWRSPYQGLCYYLSNNFDWHRDPKQFRRCLTQK